MYISKYIYVYMIYPINIPQSCRGRVLLCPKSGRKKVKMRSGEVESPTKYASDLGTQILSQNEEQNSGMSGGKLVKLMI